MDQFISKGILDMLSYRSNLGQSLKQISLRSTPLERILDDMMILQSTAPVILTFWFRRI